MAKSARERNLMGGGVVFRPPSTRHEEVERASYVDPYRPPAKAAGCTCTPPPEPAFDPDCPEHGARAGTGYADTLPAPPWVPAVVDGTWARLPARYQRGALIPHVLAWCADGEPVHRAETFLTWLSCLPGFEVSESIMRWTYGVRRTGSGRSKKATKLRHVEAVRIRASYDEAWPNSRGAIDAVLLRLEKREDERRELAATIRARAVDGTLTLAMETLDQRSQDPRTDDERLLLRELRETFQKLRDTRPGGRPQ